MKKLLLFTGFLVIFSLVEAQQKKEPAEYVDASYFVTHNRSEYMQKLVDLHCDIQLNDSVQVIL